MIKKLKDFKLKYDAWDTMYKVFGWTIICLLFPFLFWYAKEANGKEPVGKESWIFLWVLISALVPTFLTGFNKVFQVGMLGKPNAHGDQRGYWYAIIIATGAVLTFFIQGGHVWEW